MKLRKVTALFAAAALAAGLCACGGAGNTEAAAEKTESAEAADAGEDTSAETEKEIKEIDVVLDWYPNAIHTFLYEAIEKEYFAQEGLSVNLISPADSVDAITFVASGKAQIGLTYPVEIVQAVENEMPVRALAAVSQKPLDCLCTLGDSEVTADMASLKGHKVGYSGTSVAEATVRTIAASAGLKDDDYEMINVGFDLVTSLTTGSVDLVAGTFINDEVVTMKNAGFDINVYSEQDYGVPELYGLVMAVNAESYDADPEMYAAFLRACSKGFEDMASGEEEAMRVIMGSMNSDDNPLDEEQQKESYNILMERMQTADAPFLSMDEQIWNDIITWMNESGLIAGTYTAADVTVGA